MDQGLRDMSRHARQMILPEVGQAGQQRLARAHVLVVGAGGLGCPVLQYLAGAGVGTLTVIDPDEVDESNLHRQPLYHMGDIGTPKVDAATRHLRAAHPSVDLRPQAIALTPANAPELVCAADIIVDAADSFAVSYTLSDTCLAMRRPLVSASGLGHSGYAGAFCGGAPSLRAVFPDLPERGATCATAGVLGPVVGMLGAMQAQMVLQLLLDLAPSPLGHLVTMDSRGFRFGGFSFLGAAEPAAPLRFIAPAQLTGRDIVIELRAQDEAPIPATPNALRMTPETLDQAAFPHDTRVVLCCSTGLRAWHAAARLRAAGHDKLALMAYGGSA